MTVLPYGYRVRSGFLVTVPLPTVVTATVWLSIANEALMVRARVTTSDTVKVPAPSAFTVTDALVVDPTIEPFPLIVHPYVTAPPLGLTVAL